MLRSLYSGISGLRSHQTMLDVTGNNIANVNTAGFKASTTVFQDTLSQLTQGAGSPQTGLGGTNPAQIGLGVQVAGITTNFAQGSAQATGRATDVMISGNGFFVTRQGNDTIYTRAGSFDFDSDGRLVTPDGKVVQGYQVRDGKIDDGGPMGDVALPLQSAAPAKATTEATVQGNLPADSPLNSVIQRDIKIYDTSGAAGTLTLTFTRTNAGWDVSGDDARGNVGTTSLAFTNGVQSGPSSLTLGNMTVDLSTVTDYAALSSVSISEQNGHQAGTLEGFVLGKDGTLTAQFSNGESTPAGRIALATFTNPAGLEKVGSSGYRISTNSGQPTLGTAGSGGVGTLSSGTLEMSNVDLSQEFTNLIVAQRGFQANARIITTSDEVLQELTNLKR